MKRLTTKYRKWLLHRSAGEMRKRHGAISSSRKGVPRRAKFREWEERFLGAPAFAGYRMRPGVFGVTMPQAFDTRANPEETFATIAGVRAITSHRRARLGHIDFSPIRSLDPAATLLLTAEIDTWQRSIPGRLRPLPDTWHPDVHRLLSEMGLFQLLNLPLPASHSRVSSSDAVRFTPFLTGLNTDGDKVPVLRRHIEALVGATLSPPESRSLFAGLSEAFDNVLTHAYPADGNVERRWWISASFDAISRQLTVLCCDRGIGIPSTLPRSGMWESVRNRMFRLGFDLRDHGQLIRQAVQSRRSATKASHRGRGLKKMLDFIKVHDAGSLVITSLRGSYRCERRPDGRLLHSTRTITPGLDGTLIEWTVALGGGPGA